MFDYTIVVGVDKKHLGQLRLTFPTWVKHKPSLMDNPLVVFYDSLMTINELKEAHNIVCCNGRGPISSTWISWPPDGVEYEGDESNKFLKSQRYKMLAGFVHIAAKCVKTPYWLKLDCDTVATGIDDWIDESWFESNPAIIAQPWGFTKPPDQMVLLDKWVEKNKYENKMGTFSDFLPLNLVPRPGWSRVSHKRIISWCGFFNTQFTRLCSEVAESLCGEGKMPVKSQDGFMWYLAKRGQFGIVRVNMKKLGWQHKSNEGNIKKAIREVM